MSVVESRNIELSAQEKYDAFPSYTKSGMTTNVLPTAVEESFPQFSSTGGVTPLMQACQQGHESSVRQLIHKDSRIVRERDRTGKTALHYCAENSSLTCIDQILAVDPSLLSARDEDGYTPLHLATIAGNRSVARYLLSKGADVHATDNEKHTAVHWATVCGEVELLELLIDSGGNPSTPDIHGAYPIHYAAQMCGPNSELGQDVKAGLLVLQTLLQKGVDVSVKDHDGRQPLLWAASAGSADAILALVNAGADVASDDKDGLTALHCAASRGHLDCLDVLISLCSAEVDTLDANGCTPLFYAATLGHADCTELLLKHGSIPDRQDRKGRTPAHCGAAKGQLETLKLLHKRGADLWKRNVKGDLPLHEAIQSGRKDLVMWLLSLQPVSVNAPNNDGRCPLHIAAINNNTEMCKILMDYKATVNPIMRNSRGQLLTPVDAAVARGNKGCAKYLQLHGGLPAIRLTDKRALQAAMQRALEFEPTGHTGATPSDLTGELTESSTPTMSKAPFFLEIPPAMLSKESGTESQVLSSSIGLQMGYTSDHIDSGSQTEGGTPGLQGGEMFTSDTYIRDLVLNEEQMMMKEKMKLLESCQTSELLIGQTMATIEAPKTLDEEEKETKNQKPNTKVTKITKEQEIEDGKEEENGKEEIKKGSKGTIKQKTKTKKTMKKDDDEEKLSKGTKKDAKKSKKTKSEEEEDEESDEDEDEEPKKRTIKHAKKSKKTKSEEEVEERDEDEEEEPKKRTIKHAKKSKETKSEEEEESEEEEVEEVKKRTIKHAEKSKSEEEEEESDEEDDKELKKRPNKTLKSKKNRNTSVESDKQRSGSQESEKESQDETVAYESKKKDKKRRTENGTKKSKTKRGKQDKTTESDNEDKNSSDHSAASSSSSSESESEDSGTKSESSEPRSNQTDQEKQEIKKKKLKSVKSNEKKGESESDNEVNAEGKTTNQITKEAASIKGSKDKEKKESRKQQKEAVVKMNKNEELKEVHKKEKASVKENDKKVSKSKEKLEEKQDTKKEHKEKHNKKVSKHQEGKLAKKESLLESNKLKGRDNKIDIKDKARLKKSKSLELIDSGESKAKGLIERKVSSLNNSFSASTDQKTSFEAKIINPNSIGVGVLSSHSKSKKLPSKIKVEEKSADQIKANSGGNIVEDSVPASGKPARELGDGASEDGENIMTTELSAKPSRSKVLKKKSASKSSNGNRTMDGSSSEAAPSINESSDEGSQGESHTRRLKEGQKSSSHSSVETVLPLHDIEGVVKKGTEQLYPALDERVHEMHLSSSTRENNIGLVQDVPASTAVSTPKFPKQNYSKFEKRTTKTKKVASQQQGGNNSTSENSDAETPNTKGRTKIKRKTKKSPLKKNKNGPEAEESDDSSYETSNENMLQDGVSSKNPSLNGDQSSRIGEIKQKKERMLRGSKNIDIENEADAVVGKGKASNIKTKEVRKGTATIRKGRSVTINTEGKLPNGDLKEDIKEAGRRVMSGGPRKVDSMDTNLKKKRNVQDYPVDMSVTRAMQTAMRKYTVERRLFQQLLDLKRLQIRNSRANEHMLIKRMVNEHWNDDMIGLKTYNGAYSFANYEKYLYDQLRTLQASDLNKIHHFKGNDDVEKLTRALRKANVPDLNDPIDDLINGVNDKEKNVNSCNHSTHRCHHAIHAYTGVPCAAYLAQYRRAEQKNNKGILPRVGAPNVARNTVILESRKDEPGVARTSYDPQKPLTVEFQPTNGKKEQESIVKPPSETLPKQEPLKRDLVKNGPLRKDPLHKDPVNKGLSNREPINRNPPHNDPLKKNPLNREPFNNSKLNKSPLSNGSLNSKDPLNKIPLNKDQLKKGPIKKDPLKKGPLNKNLLSKVPLNKDQLNTNPLDKDENISSSVASAPDLDLNSSQQESSEDTTQQQPTPPTEERSQDTPPTEEGNQETPSTGEGSQDPPSEEGAPKENSE